MKKAFALLLTLLLVFSVSSTAFAAYSKIQLATVKSGGTSLFPGISLSEPPKCHLSAGSKCVIIPNSSSSNLFYRVKYNGILGYILKSSVNVKKVAPKVYKPGIYKVGINLPAGEYCLKCSGGYIVGHYEVTTDLSKQPSSILTSHYFGNWSYITVKNGQYLNVLRCDIIPIDQSPEPKYLKDNYLPDGMYKAGYNICAGIYLVVQTTQEYEGYWCLDKDSYHNESSHIANDLFRGVSYVTVQNGQYLIVGHAKIKLYSII